MTLILLRHGLTEGNLKHYYCGSADVPLAPEGIADLQKKRARHHYPTVRHWYTSGMRRTEETFAILFGDRPHEVLPDLRETNFGDFELRAYDGDLEQDAAFAAWCADSERLPCPNGESTPQVTARALAALAPVLARNEDALCVTHGGVIGCLLMHWFPEIPNRYACSPHSGDGFAIEFENGNPISYHAVP